MRERLLAILTTALAYAQALNHWLSRELYLTLLEVHEFGFADRLAAVVEAGGRDRAQLGFQTIIAALVIVITVMLTTIVLDKFDQNLGTPSDPNLADAQNNVTSAYADMVGLVAPLLLVAMAVVIIGLLRRVS